MADHSPRREGPQPGSREPYTAMMTQGSRTIGGMVVLAAMAGCGGSIKPSFDSPEPAARNAAIVHAASTGDKTAIPDLVRMLESDDPATRMLAITTLERLTGETHGYVAKDKPSVRREAVRRWQEAVGGGQDHRRGEP